SRAYNICQEILNQRKDLINQRDNRIIYRLKNMYGNYSIKTLSLFYGDILIDRNVNANKISILLARKSNLVYIPEIQTVGDPNVFRLHLSKQGLSPATIDRLLS